MEAESLEQTAGRMTSLAYVHERVDRSRSSFDFVIRSLTKHRRTALAAFYAFCREVDDAVDEAPSLTAATTGLAAWREEVEAAFRGHPGHPILRVLMPVAGDYSIEAEHLHAIIDGCEMDLGRVRHPDFASLEKYCALVAGTVGDVAARIFGYADPGTPLYARRLGLALQLTNILRDVGEDALRGRIYLPLEDLRRFGVTESALLARELRGGQEERFLDLMRFESRRAHDIYDDAMAMLPGTDIRRQWAGLAMAGIYRALLRRIEARGFPVLHQRCSLAGWHKAWIVATVFLRPG